MCVCVRERERETEREREREDDDACMCAPGCALRFCARVEFQTLTKARVVELVFSDVQLLQDHSSVQSILTLPACVCVCV